MSTKLKMLGPLCNQTVNLKTDSKSLYYSALKLKYSPSILKHNKGEKKYESLNNSHNNFHRNYTNDLCVLQDARHELLFFFGDFCASGMQDVEATKSHGWGGEEGRVHSSKP